LGLGGGWDSCAAFGQRGTVCWDNLTEAENTACSITGVVRDADGNSHPDKHTDPKTNNDPHGHASPNADSNSHSHGQTDPNAKANSQIHRDADVLAEFHVLPYTIAE
jgi:hypothetical protein